MSSPPLGRPRSWIWHGLPLLGAALLFALTLTSVALANHQRPSSASPLRLPLVPTYEDCLPEDFDSVHGPEGLDSCSGPTPESARIRTGTLGTSSGFVKLKVFCTNAETPACPAAGDQEDVSIQVVQTDVRCNQANFNCAASGNDYTGNVMLRLPLRITDHDNRAAPGPPVACPNSTGTSPCVTATVLDLLEFGILVPCTQVGGVTNPGANCSLTTTLDAQVPMTLATENQRAIFRLAEEVDLLEPGPDKSFTNPGCPYTCGTGDEEAFVAQGWFVP